MKAIARLSAQRPLSRLREYGFGALGMMICALLLGAGHLEEVYECPPCGCDHDGQHFDRPGRCPSCAMKLVQAKRARNQPTTVAILVFDGVQIIDFSGPYEVFGQSRFDVFTVSRDGKPLNTAMNLRIEPRHSFSTAPTPDVLVIPGGHVDKLRTDRSIQEWIRRTSREADHVLSVCNGALVLASTGLLDGKTATTFYKALDELERSAPKTRIVRDQRFVDNGKIITSAGL
ncbi:MAG: DJ-1/PfpI family protein [Myxococcota bacterium]